MTEIDEFKAKLRGEVESAMERIREMQDQARYVGSPQEP